MVAAVPRQRAAEVSVEIADTLVDDDDIIDFLHTLTQRTAELLDAAVVGLVLADSWGQLQFVAASDEASTVLQLFEVQRGEGPSLDAFRTGQAVTCRDLGETVGRWPVFGRARTSSPSGGCTRCR
jgi:hypothetical protein